MNNFTGVPPAVPPPKPGRVKVYKALYNYIANQADELSFEEGDILYIIDSSDTSGWWTARCGGKVGLVPSNYVSESAESIDYPLHEAAKRGNTDFLEECLRNQVSVNCLDKSGSTAMYWAAHSGHVDILNTLLKVPNANVVAQNKLGDTALHAAAWKAHAECAQVLIQAGANLHTKNHQGKTAADLAKNPEVAALIKRATNTAPPSDFEEYQYDESGEDSD